MKIGMASLGCMKNLVDTEVMVGILADQNHEIIQDVDEAEAIIINTCSFIDSAKAESIETILEYAKLKQTRKCSWIIVTGCLVQNYKEKLLDLLPEIDILVGTGEFYKIDTIINNIANTSSKDRASFINDPSFLYDNNTPRRRLSLPHIGYVKISEGCDHSCSYCLIPTLRGRYRCRDSDSIIYECIDLAQEGVKEICLIAQDTTAYSELAKILDKVAKKIYPVWLRLLYTYPLSVNEHLLNTMSFHENICPYIDFPIQHINDRILSSMNRSGTRAEIENIISKMKKIIPSISIRTTLMVGFPGETMSEYCELVDFIKDVRFDHVGVFSYSRQEGTRAYDYKDQIPEKVIKERYDILMQTQSAISAEKCFQFVESIQNVIVDYPYQKHKEFMVGRTKKQAPEIDGCVLIKKQKSYPNCGDILDVSVYDSNNYDLFATPA